jgi:hypothetical protein
MSCGTAQAGEQASGFNGTNVTYCFKVTNTGATHLTNVTIGDPILAFSDNSIGRLAPGASAVVYFQSKITNHLINIANAIGFPCNANGIPLGGDPATNLDPSEVALLTDHPRVRIINTIYGGSDNGATCGNHLDSEQAEVYLNDPVVYCFHIINNGDTYLNNIKVDNVDLNFQDHSSKGRLGPGEIAMVFVWGKVTKSFINTANVTAVSI